MKPSKIDFFFRQKKHVSQWQTCYVPWVYMQMPTVLEHLLYYNVFYLVLWEEPVLLLRFVRNISRFDISASGLPLKIRSKSVEQFAIDVDVRLNCWRGVMLLHACRRSTGGPPYPRVIRSKTYRGYVKPRIVPNAICNLI